MRPRRVGEVLDAALKIYLRRARTLMGAAAAVVIPLQVVTALVLISIAPTGADVPNGSFGVQRQVYTDKAAFLGGEAALFVLSIIAGSLVTAACIQAVSNIYLDEPASIGSSLRSALRRLPAILVLEVVFWLGVFGGLLVIVGAVWVYVAWAVCLPALLLERRGPGQALGRSSKLVQGRWWATFAVLIVAFLMTTVVGIIIGVALRAVSLHSQPSVLFAVIVTTAIGAVAAIITRPFSAAVTTVLYYDLRVRKEGFDLKVLVDQLDRDYIESPDGALAEEPLPYGPEAVGRPGGPPFWPPPADWVPPARWSEDR
jgi:hypothetical protein